MKAKKKAVKKSAKKSAPAAHARAFDVGARVKVIRGDWGNSKGRVVECESGQGAVLVQLDSAPRRGPIVFSAGDLRAL